MRRLLRDLAQTAGLAVLMSVGLCLLLTLFGWVLIGHYSDPGGDGGADVILGPVQKVGPSGS